MHSPKTLFHSFQLDTTTKPEIEQKREDFSSVGLQGMIFNFSKPLSSKITSLNLMGEGQQTESLP